MMLVSQQQYFKGGRSICRNPILQKMFMRLGHAEKAGSGVDKIVSGWKSLDLPVPTVAEETRPDYVVLTLELKDNFFKDTPQDTPGNKNLKKELRKRHLLEFCTEPKSLAEIIHYLGLKDRKNFVDGYITPMIADGTLAMTEPDKKNSGNQRYITVKNK